MKNDSNLFDDLNDSNDFLDSYIYELTKHGYTTSMIYSTKISAFFKINDIITIQYNKIKNERFMHHGKSFIIRARIIDVTPKLVESPLHMLRVLNNWKVVIEKLR